MQNFEFLRFEETPEAKHFGIAHIRYHGSLVLKFKLVENKDGSGYFVVPPSYKREMNGEEKWSQWFFMDSRSEEEYLQDFIKNNVSQILKKSNTSQQSVNQGFNQPNPYQQQQNAPVQQANTQNNPWDDQDANVPF